MGTKGRGRGGREAYYSMSMVTLMSWTIWMPFFWQMPNMIHVIHHNLHPIHLHFLLKIELYSNEKEVFLITILKSVKTFYEIIIERKNIVPMPEHRLWSLMWLVNSFFPKYGSKWTQSYSFVLSENEENILQNITLHHTHTGKRNSGYELKVWQLKWIMQKPKWMDEIVS